MSLGLVVLLAGCVVGLAFVIAGVARVASVAGALKRRLDGYASLPIVHTVRETQGRVFLAQRAIANAPTLVVRVEDALETFAFARARVELAFAEALVIARSIPAILLGIA